MNQAACLALVGVLLLLQNSARTQPKSCASWQAPYQIGTLPDLIDEASGVAVSRKFPGRMYHVNDSGDSGRFFVTNMTGANMRIVNISGFRPRDVEAIAVGPCDKGKTCIFVADIGDNERRRRAVEIAVIDETSDLPSVVKPKYRLRVKYPVESNDAEGLAVHPDGTIYILTKSLMPRLFRLPRRAWESGGAPIQTLEPVLGLRGAGLPTDLSISDDGSRFLVLTYLDAVEYDKDFVPHAISLRRLPQQEAITYLPGSRSFIYTTERAGSSAPIMRSDLGSCDR